MAIEKAEKKALIISTIVLVIFFTIIIFSKQLSIFYDESNFLLYHTLLELFSIFISYSIFFYGWLTFPHSRSYRLLILSMVFFLVGTYDLFHTFSYTGSPFITNIDQTSASAWFWMMARYTESIGIIAAFLIPYRIRIDNKRKNIANIFTLFLIVSITFFILYFPEHLPVLIISGYGSTTLKVILEMIVISLHIFALILVIKIYKKSDRKRSDLLTISIGIIFIILSEISFIMYHHVHNINNLLGHSYKVLGYFYLLKGIYFPHFDNLFKQKEKAESRWHKAVQKLKDQEKKMTSLIIKAQEDERKRVSQDLHDGVGQMLYSILISLKSIKRITSDEKVLNHIKEIEGLTSSTMNEVKNIAHMLRPSALDDLGFIPAIRSHIEKFAKTFNIEVDLHIDGSQKRVAPEIETALFRICQEALNNAAKYSNATSIDVIILIIENQIELSVVDNGEGFDLEEISNSHNQGLGLFGMQERAEIVNGKTTIISNKGLGTIIHVAIPI